MLLRSAAIPVTVLCFISVAGLAGDPPTFPVELARRLNPKGPADAVLDCGRDGYANIEEYVSSVTDAAMCAAQRGR